MPIAFPEPVMIETNGICMAVHSEGSGPPVVLLHGFPELAYSWRHQLPALAAAGYRAIAPDLRGYGGTDKPTGVSDYAIDTLIADVTGLLDALQLPRAFFIGHDWGALLLWQMALVVPQRIAGLVALNIPFLPRPAVDPVALMRDRLGPDFYIVNFQDSSEADRRFAEDPARFIDRMMRRRPITRERFDGLPRQHKTMSLLALLDRPQAAGDPLLDEVELSVYAAAFAKGGFTGPINWYRNWSRNWAASEYVEQRIRVPALFIGATDDIVVSPAQIEAMRPYVDDLEIQTIDKCGHWTQQEVPDELNERILDWMRRRYPAGKPATGASSGKPSRQ